MLGFAVFGLGQEPDVRTIRDGAVAQLGEHLLCKQGVVGSIPISSTIWLRVKDGFRAGSVAQVVRARP